MVIVNKFKIDIQKTLKQPVEFIGENFDDIVKNLSTNKANRIITWTKNVKEQHIQPILKHSNKKYKEWHISELMSFRYPFQIQNQKYRIILIKVKNSYYIEFHIGNHKYGRNLQVDFLHTRR